MLSTLVLNTTASASLAIVTVIGLILLLVARELTYTSEKPPLKLFSSNITIFAIPLLIVFAFIAIIDVLKAVS